MCRRQREVAGNQWISQTKQILKREGTVLFILLSMIAGAAAFFATLGKTWELEQVNWWGLIVFIPIIRLPHVYNGLKRHEDKPYLVRFAIAFKEGFWVLPSLAPNLSKSVTAMRRFWKNSMRK